MKETFIISTLLAGDVDAIRDVPAFAVEQLASNDAVTLQYSNLLRIVGEQTDR